MSNYLLFEWITDSSFVILSVIGSVGIVVYLWARYGRSRGRYK